MISCAMSICRARGRASRCRRCPWARRGTPISCGAKPPRSSTPADIHAIGVAETERLRGRLQSLLAEAGFAGNAQAYFEAAQREPRVAYKAPEELLDFYAQLKVSAAAALSA